MLTKDKFIEFCIEQHDVVCNQKYNKVHPYSFHLHMVYSQAKKFKKLVDGSDIDDVAAACYGHDLIEDARLTYNDIVEMVGVRVADIIYCCTEEKGKNRAERHSEKYYLTLAKNDLAVFVKLCDIIANVKYSLLTNSGMFEKYKKEHSKTYDYLYIDQYADMFSHLDQLFDFESL